MGRVIAPFGVQGWVKIEPWSVERDSLCKIPVWWIGKSGEMREVAVKECRLHGALVIAKFQGCGNRDQAIAYRGKEVAVRREDLPQVSEGEIYQADLIGFEVVNTKRERLGKITGFLDNGAHEVARIGYEGGERLVPFVAPVVREVNSAAGRVEVEWELDW